jgi:hypothetical protein
MLKDKSCGVTDRSIKKDIEEHTQMLAKPSFPNESSLIISMQ